MHLIIICNLQVIRVVDFQFIIEHRYFYKNQNLECKYIVLRNVYEINELFGLG